MNFKATLLSTLVLATACGGMDPAQEVVGGDYFFSEEPADPVPNPGIEKPLPKTDPEPEVAYFCATDGVNWSWGLDRFVVRIEDPDVIAEARQLVALQQVKIITGDVIPAPVNWNDEWNFHIDPNTVGFAEAAIEVCDGTAEFVNQCGGPYNGRWCPWQSYLLEEIQDPTENSLSVLEGGCRSDGPRRPPTYQCLGGGGGA